MGRLAWYTGVMWTCSLDLGILLMPTGLDGAGSWRSGLCLQSAGEFLLSMCVLGAK